MWIEFKFEDDEGSEISVEGVDVYLKGRWLYCIGFLFWLICGIYFFGWS